MTSVTWIPGSITFHHAPIHYNTICTQHAGVKYSLDPTRIWTYNLLQTDCKITPLVIPITSVSLYQQQYRGDELRKSGYFCTLFCSPGSKYRTVLNSFVFALLILLLHERMSRRSTQFTRYATKIKDESSDIKRKISEMAKNNHSTVRRVEGFNIFHLVQRKNYDLYCACVCCSSQHHTNAKTKLSSRAGLSVFGVTYCA